MTFKQTLASIGLSGYFGVVFMVAAPHLSVGLVLTYGAISMALGFAITALSKAIGDAFPKAPDGARNRHFDEPPPPYTPDPAIRVTIAPRVYHQPSPPPRVFTNPFANLFAKPAAKVVDRHVEPSRPSFVPPLFEFVPPPARSVPAPQPPVTFSNRPPKPPARVVERHVEPSSTHSNLPPKPAPRVVSHSIQPSR